MKHFSASAANEYAVENSEVLKKLNRYVKNLVKWNSYFNLFSFEKDRAFEEIVIKSLYFVKEIEKRATAPHIAVCDVGSGCGIPGMVIQISLPVSEVTLIESNGKKAEFLRRMKYELALENLAVANENAREFARKSGKIYNFVVGRAFGGKFYDYAAKLVKDDGKILYYQKSMDKRKFRKKPDSVLKCEKGFLVLWNG
ncbi:MAG: 16S rRNA (guanine(527)-N(7))-methyltransferase RsmG [Elusimicrobia bacterium]|nr:16S rRNA (guanine(527)-N(7))-methyltransferase RsmG [Elusimicrobiota bacterium]